MSNEELREKFEAWVCPQMSSGITAITRTEKGEYEIGVFEFAWRAYQEGAALAQAEAQPEPVAEFLGRRRAPEGTTEFWGVMLCDPMQDPTKGTKLYLAPQPAALAVALAKNGPCVSVDDGALQMVRNALRRDADDGKVSRGEMLAELDATTQPAAPAVPAGWQPIETAPRDGTLFLGWVGAERWSSPDGECSSHAHDVSQVDFCWWRQPHETQEGGYFDNAAGQIGDSQDVTHWMPLPAAPEVKP